MITNGKILFFNESEGKGIIITSQIGKIDFYVGEWDDYNLMPSLGLEVSFFLRDNVAYNILAKSSRAAVQANEEKQGLSFDVETSEENLQKQADNEEETPLHSDVQSHNFTEDTEEEQDAQNVSDEPSKQHFYAQNDIQTLYDVQDDTELEKEQRPENITITLNISSAVSHYFDIIKNHINKRISYKKVNGRLDYILVRRFLWTTFNNLSEIDLHIITPKIKMLTDDLKVMSSVYKNFTIKIKHPTLAYQEVFLSCQAEYVHLRSGAEKTIEKLNRLKSNEEHIGEILKVKKKELNVHEDPSQFNTLNEELKSINGAYVDVVHMMAELDENYKYTMQLLSKFEQEYREDFYKIFHVQAQKHHKDLIEILNAQAYLIDAILWQEAKKSKHVMEHFKKASIVGEFNTKTYLKYYLDTLDSKKTTQADKNLFVLYDYLSCVYKEYILVIVSCAQDAMEHEASIKNIDKSYNVKSFIDEKSALKWAMKNSVKVLIIEDKLQKMNAEIFLNVYHKHILLKPKIILVGDKHNTNLDAYSISKLLLSSVSSRVIAENVKSLLSAQS
ncbi:hypothetical protein KKG72_03440 [bacterium]|nr:hypothetical protein [bacterium]MBU1993746.1 hypothetical protein [bacterium]